MRLNYRMHNPDDIDALVQFWKENSGWDDIDRNEWERRFLHTPYGSASVAIAEDVERKEIVGQMIFIPTKVSVDGSELSAHRPYAMVVKQSYKQLSGYLKLVDMVAKLYNYAIAIFKESGVSLIHMMPDQRWSRLLKFLPALQIGSFPLWSLPLETHAKFEMPFGFDAEPISAADERIDQLWQESVQLYGCSVQRNAASLPWKTSHGNYQLLGIYKKGELKGVVASIAKLKDKQWLICDMLTADGDETLTATIQAACRQAVAYKAQLKAHEEMNKVAVLTTPLMEQVITPIGFKKEDYKFPMLVQLLDKSLTKQQVAPERWYASAND